MTRVKVCGIMNARDIQHCAGAGVHGLGFVVDYPVPVPWNLTVLQAKDLMGQVPPFISTCAVVGGSVEKILSIAEQARPHIIQLHDTQTLQEIKECVQELNSRGIKAIKALRFDQEGNCDFEISDPVAATRELAKTGLSALLVDSYSKSRPGGTGVKVNVAVFKAIQKESTVPVILAGGLNPENISTIIRQTHPYAVDVLTGVEEAPGHKDVEKIKGFMKGCRLISEG